MSRDDITIDLKSNLHGSANEFMMDSDRRWFDEHTGRARYVRELLPHEWCDPRHAVEGRCVSMFDVPEGQIVMVEVIELGPGLRARMPFLVRVGAA